MQSLFDFIIPEPLVPYAPELRVTFRPDGAVLLQGFANNVLMVEGVDESLWRLTRAEFMGMEHKAIHDFDNFGMTAVSSHDETLRNFSISAAVDGSDQQDGEELNRLVPGVAAVTKTDRHDMAEGGRSVSALVSLLDSDKRRISEDGLVVPAIGSVLAGDGAHRKELTGSVLAQALISMPTDQIAVVEVPVISLEASVLGIRSDVTLEDNWFIGEYTIFEYIVKRADGVTPQDITNWSFEWVLRRHAHASGVGLTKTVGNGIAIVNGPAGQLRLEVTPAQSLLLVPGQWAIALKRITAGFETVLSHGNAALQMAASR